jgi:APA family basic amino acid/polyamine antiporter
MVMRKRHPDIRRPFRTPWVWLVGPLAIVVCGGQMLGLPRDTWIRLFVWMAIGLVIYFSYSRRHSVLNVAEGKRDSGLGIRDTGPGTRG